MSDGVELCTMQMQSHHASLPWLSYRTLRFASFFFFFKKIGISKVYFGYNYCEITDLSDI